MFPWIKSKQERNTEQLSAYLDDALSASERKALEARLKTDASLRRELDALRQTQAVLQSLPKVTAPRNFTLTAEQANAIRRVRTAPAMDLWLRTATAVVAMLLVVVVLGNRMSLTGMPQAAMAPAPMAGSAEDVFVESVPVAESGDAELSVMTDDAGELTAEAEGDLGVAMVPPPEDEPEPATGGGMVGELTPESESPPSPDEGAGSGAGANGDGERQFDATETEAAELALLPPPAQAGTPEPTAPETEITSADLTQDTFTSGPNWLLVAEIGLGLLLAGLLVVVLVRWRQR